MYIYLTELDAIFGLHEKGYTNEFQLSGNDLLWIKNKMALRVGDFSILEYHRFRIHLQKKELIILGIISLSTIRKGILIIYEQSTGFNMPPIIFKKIKEMNVFFQKEKVW